MIIAVVVAVGGVAAGGWLLAMHLTGHASGRHAPRVAVTQLAVTHSATVTTSPPSPTITPSYLHNVGTVTVSPAVAARPDAPSVGAFLNRYFNAINDHAYLAYTALLGPKLQQAMTPAEFTRGYRTTRDSAATLTGISSASNGDLVASVTFTSHQAPADSVDGSACTHWAITLYLASNGASFLIDQPPSSYHASYTAC